MAWPKDDYVSAIVHAGADVRLLTPAEDPVESALSGCDGLLLTGGSDVEPTHYGDADRHPTIQSDPSRDAYEMALIRRAIDQNLPLLAICRGAQILNVAAGGTLFQDLPSQRGGDLNHSIKTPQTSTVHDVHVVPDTTLAALLHDTLDAGHRVAVNSRHHQAVRAVAPAFRVSATAPDGVIEAIENPSARFCVGVQWHPENFWKTGEFSSLFAGFVEAARAHQREG
jgi:putative glutamine amidotransferase